MLRQNPSGINWQFLLVGLFVIIMQCDARAVNVSNTWTMPQEGLNVFYRFFRDRISWFEADAVCQFHHANLVTVDNSFQFDATRDLLRELDVNDIVWIGLMRPQSSDRFMWSSNSRALVADTGYWAESLPLMDAPLCAVIDPIRDYRWHALRCGGPETASFLCEMPVPSWADACNLKDMPNLTLQYMADTASIELIRNCQEEGLLRTMCRGKQDRERALQDLICPRERLEAQRINDITNSHFKSLQIINSIPTDNNENNDIELLPMEMSYGAHYPEELQTEKNTVQRLIEQFNVDELMQADEPSNMETISSFYKISGLIPKPVKKSAKKMLDYPKKDSGKQKSTGGSMLVEQASKDRTRLPVEMDDMMMGDQPLQGEPEMTEQFLNEEVSNEILEPLPHIKKTNIHKDDSLEKMEKEAIEMKKSMQKSIEMEHKKMIMMSPTTTTTTTTTTKTTEAAIITTSSTSSPIRTSTLTAEAPLTTTTVSATAKAKEENTRVSTDHKHKTHFETHHTGFDNSRHILATTISPVTISHPIHPQQPHGSVLTDDSQHPHTKKPTDSSHFIPPMLMVKSHYIPPASKHGHNEHDHHHQQQQHYPHQQQQPSHVKHGEQHLHLETTTEEPTGKTTIKHEPKQTSDKTMIAAATTPEVLSEQKTYLGTSLSSSVDKKKQTDLSKKEQYQVELRTTTEKDPTMKPVTEPQQQQQKTTETEILKKSKNLQFKETQTTMTATTLQSAASSITAKIDEKNEMKALSNNSETIYKNNENKEKDKDETQEFKLPQTSDTDGETTQATTKKIVATTEKFLKSKQELNDLETAAQNAEKIKEIPDTRTTITTTTTVETTLPTQDVEEQQTLAMNEKLTAIKNYEKIKELLQIKTETTEKMAPAQTAEVIKTTTTKTVSQAITQQNPTTIKTDTETETETLQQIEKESTNKEKLDEYNENEPDKKETLVKPTEILQTSTALTKEQQEKIHYDDDVDEEDEEEKDDTPSAIATRTILTATTTVKPITAIMPQNEVKSTQTSFSSAITIISTTTTTTTPTTYTTNIPRITSEDNVMATSTLKPPTSTAAASAISTTTEGEIDITTTATPPTISASGRARVRAKTSKSTQAQTQTQTQTPEATESPESPETTQNFLKVTTETPFKPNRRRTLTKPETLSYMKKILG